MKLRSRTGILGLGGALLTLAVVGVALAGAPEVPKGPSIDFCPTTEQIESHLAQYGFDYKPTVSCTEDGVELTGAPAEEQLTAAEVEAQDRASLKGASRGPDVDGDPRTMEVVYPDGSGATILISADNPERFKDMTPAEFLELVYGDE